MIAGADFDHVAVAAESRTLLEPRYADQLGGNLLAQGPGPGFFWIELVYANGVAVEMLEPRDVEVNDFLRRFLDRNGPGPHHLTFHVPDFGQALAAAEEAGYRPVGIDDSDPDWKEAFLHPKEAPGVVIQLAESHEHHQPAVRDRSTPAATLVHVAHAVRSRHDGVHLFEGLLGGTPTSEGSGPDYRWVDFDWPRTGRVRVLAPTGPGPLDEWLGDRTGRLHHLAFALARPEGQPEAVPHDGHWRVEPDANHGTRLLLAADAAILSGPLPL